MKKVALILIVFSMLSGSAWASSQAPLKELSILCITSYPTTSFIGVTNGSDVVVRLVNSNGVDFMPIASHLVTTHDLKMLQKKATVLKAIGEESTFHFALKNCEIYKDGTFRCNGNEKFTSEAGVEMEAISLDSKFISSQFMDFEFKEVQLTAVFKVAGETHDVSMKFDPTECGIHFIK